MVEAPTPDGELFGLERLADLLEREAASGQPAEGLAAAEPVLVAVPGRRLDLVRAAPGPAAEAVSFADMVGLGRNPARIIPAIRRFTDSRRPRRTRFVGEPVWAGRSAAETAEATRHEALIAAPRRSPDGRLTSGCGRPHRMPTSPRPRPAAPRKPHVQNGIIRHTAARLLAWPCQSWNAFMQAGQGDAADSPGPPRP
jgi:hypothetical protein